MPVSHSDGKSILELCKEVINVVLHQLCILNLEKSCCGRSISAIIKNFLGIKPIIILNTVVGLYNN